MSISKTTTTDLSLTEGGGRKQLETTLTNYVQFLRRQPAFCGTPEQQQALIDHVAQGQALVKLVTDERLKITRELDHQKHDWMELEKQLTEPVVAAMQPLKEAVDHYNREVMRIREHLLAEGEKTDATADEQTNWLTANVSLAEKPKGVRTKWTFKVTDPAQVPNGYWVIDEATIKADIAKGVRSIPGIDIYEDVITTFRS